MRTRHSLYASGAIAFVVVATLAALVASAFFAGRASVPRGAAEPQLLVMAPLTNIHTEVLLLKERLDMLVARTNPIGQLPNEASLASASTASNIENAHAKDMDGVKMVFAEILAGQSNQITALARQIAGVSRQEGSSGTPNSNTLRHLGKHYRADATTVRRPLTNWLKQRGDDKWIGSVASSPSIKKGDQVIITYRGGLVGYGTVTESGADQLTFECRQDDMFVDDREFAGCWVNLVNRATDEPPPSTAK